MLDHLTIRCKVKGPWCEGNGVLPCPDLYKQYCVIIWAWAHRCNGHWDRQHQQWCIVMVLLQRPDNHGTRRRHELARLRNSVDVSM